MFLFQVGRYAKLSKINIIESKCEHHRRGRKIEREERDGAIKLKAEKSAHLSL